MASLFTFGKPGALTRMKQRVRQGTRVTFGDSPGGEQALDLLAGSLGARAVSVHVPFDVDQATYVPLTIARACGPTCLREVDRLMARASATPPEVFEALDAALGGRALCVAGVDRLYVTDHELREITAPRASPLRAWLRERAIVTTSEAWRQAPGLAPRSLRRWDVDALWRAAGHDPDALQLALAFCELLGRPPPLAATPRFVEALVAELWRSLPSSMRDAVALLAAHGRAALRADVERLGVLDRATLDECVRLRVVDERLGRLHLPRPWAAQMPSLESPVMRGQRHRAWADAFALAFAADADALPAPTAALEALRHYAAVPDVARAVEHARYGCEVMLDAAVTRSKGGAWQDAVALYEGALGLDERSSALAPGAALDARARAYATHYLHYNRYKAGAEPLRETARGYEEAVRLWPENALFWSRQVRALFVAERETDAMEALAQARLAVPAHPEKEQVLVTRTVDRLLRRDLALPAAFVWGGASSGPDRVVGDDLNRRLLRGVTTRRLWAPDLPAVSSASPYTFVLRGEAGGAVSCDVDGTSREGRTRVEALWAAVRACIVKELVARWRRETGGSSVLAARVQHPAWHLVVSLGRDAVPEILRAIESQPDHWHAALVQLTGHDPFTGDARMRTSEVCARWVAWGRARGMRW